jgi:DNA-binding transcriptional MerR regulator
LIEPIRKESGHRLYTRQHIDQINRITALTQQGIRISQITPEMLESEPPVEDGDDAQQGTWKNYLNSMMAAIIDFDEQRLEEIYNEALSLYPIAEVTRRLLTPLLIELGLRWEADAGSIAEEHFFSFYLRNKMGARYHHQVRNRDGRLILLAGLPYEHHEIGLLLFALAANDRGYRILPLGANLPLGELPAVAESKSVDAIVLTGAIEPSAEVLTNALPALVRRVRVPVLVGGLASVYACDAITRAGAVALGRDIGRGLHKLSETLDSTD